MKCCLPALILMLCFSRCHSEEPDVKTLAVVKTWKELLAQPVIDLGDGIKVRLGIENQKCPKWSGMLLYCLAEGYAPPSKEDADNVVGPVRVEIQYGDVKIAESVGSYATAKSDFDDVLKGSKVLYCKLVSVDRVGKVKVTLRKSKHGDPLARFELEGSDDSFHPWIPMQLHRDDNLVPAATDEKDVTVGSVSNRHDGIALPNWDGRQPILFESKNIKLAEADALPNAIPTTESPAMTIAVRGKTIRITSTFAFLVRRPDWHFLSRWWVNGKPYVPKQLEEFPSDQDGLVDKGKTLDLHVLFDPKKIGAKKGDKIGLQLLYCRDEWKWVGNEQVTATMFSEGKMDAVELTNRVEFEAP